LKTLNNQLKVYKIFHMIKCAFNINLHVYINKLENKLKEKSDRSSRPSL